MKTTKFIIGIAAITMATPAYALTYYLTSQWYDRGNHFCRYGNGTVLIVGYSLCPPSIEG